MKSRRNRMIIAVLAAACSFMLTPLSQPAGLLVTEAAQTSDSHDSKLSAFDIAPGVLSPAFSPDITSYTSTVDADVTSVSVQAVPRNSNGSIASVEGARNLQPGLNTITVVCSAPDQSYTKYTITLTVGSAGQAQEEPAAEAGQEEAASEPEEATEGASDAQEEAADGEEAEETDTADQAEAAASILVGTISSDDTVSLNGASYKLSNNFSYGSITQDIPSAFVQGSVQVNGNTYQTLFCQSNGVNLIYMENTEGSGSTGFYFYDELQNTVERFKYTGIGDNFVIFLNLARQDLPDGYQETTLTLPSGKETVAYQNASAAGMQDFYLIYGINSDGTSGWYYYDNAQGTYLRYIQTDQVSTPVQEDVEEGEEIERTVSLDKYNSLYEKYQNAKSRMVKIVSIMAIAMVLMLIFFTALLLRNPDDEEDVDGGQEEKEGKKAKKKLKRAEKKAQSAKSLAAGRSFGTKLSRKEKEPEVTRFSPEPSADKEDEIASPDDIRRQLEQERKDKEAGRTDRSQTAAGYSAHSQNTVSQNTRVSSRSSAVSQDTRVSSRSSAVSQDTRVSSRSSAVSQDTRVSSRSSAVSQDLPAQGRNNVSEQGASAYSRSNMSEQEAPAYRRDGAAGQDSFGRTRDQAAVQGLEHASQAAAQQDYSASSRDVGRPSRSSLLKREQTSEESVQLAAEKMRQTMQRIKPSSEQNVPEPDKNAQERQTRGMSVADREAVFRPTQRISLDELQKGKDPMDEWEMEEAAVNRKHSRKKKRKADNSVEIMDLNDL